MSTQTHQLKEIYEKKTQLLFYGATISKEFYGQMKDLGTDFYKGRKGGAGPAGGRYFVFENNSPVNVALYGHKSEQSHLVLNKVLDQDPQDEGYYYVELLNQKTGEVFRKLRLVPVPEEYNKATNLDGTINRQIALIHAEDVLASTIVQKCKYWRDGTRCKFCAIELSLLDKNTIERKSPEQLLEAIRTAKPMGLCKHIVLTSGTLNRPDKGAEYYIDVVSKIKQEFPILPIHIQIEPLEDISYLKKLKGAGVDTIGIHLEIPDDSLREEYCPGKSVIPKFEFEKYWEKAVELFGRGQVTTFILIGFGEEKDETIKYIDKVIRMGVLPVIVPAREIVGTQFHPTNQYNLFKTVLDAASKQLIEHSLNPESNKAGCGRCEGCSSLNDGFRYFSEKSG